MIARGQLDALKAHSFPYRNIITRAIGTAPHVEPTVASTNFLPGDLFFLCSDGLTDCIRNEEISELLAKTPDIKEAAHQLVELAKLRGGNDNITVVLIKINEKNLPG
jgi:PPM family protein phosphatase